MGDHWSLAFKVIERRTGSVVGTCAFKGPPDADGIVEVAYGVDEEYRGRGYATEATDALVSFALGTGQVSLVRAHRRHDNAASARILAKCGFRQIGDLIDPEDGPVCRWERKAVC